MKPKRIHIIDDEPVILDSMSEWLSKKYEVSCFSSGEEYLKSISELSSCDHSLTCILLDFQMAGMNGVELQKTLKCINSKYSIIFMSGNAHQSDIIDAWRGGAVDFILKPFTPANISDLLDKQFNLMEQGAFQAITSKKLDCTINIPITRREAQTLLLLGKGSSQMEVAQQLGISLNTVKMYRAFLKDKLNLNTLVELIQYFNRHQKSIEKIANQ